MFSLACIRRSRIAALAAVFVATPAWAGPPYFTDDPQPTDYHQFEIYTFLSGTHTLGGNDGATGLDLNYGAAHDLQLTATVPVEYDHPNGRPLIGGVGNVELAAKYRFLHQEEIGVDVSVFPRVILPSVSHRIGTSHASFLLPLWVEKDWEKWSAFGGGGCAINRGGNSKDYCSAGLVVTRQFLPEFQVGLEIYHQSADVRGEHASTRLGLGTRYDFNEHVHLVASGGPGLEHRAETGQYFWYAALLFTF